MVLFLLLFQRNDSCSFDPLLLFSLLCSLSSAGLRLWPFNFLQEQSWVESSLVFTSRNLLQDCFHCISCFGLLGFFLSLSCNLTHAFFFAPLAVKSGTFHVFANFPVSLLL